ncbi:MAG: SulP family inorganic anion transporter [Waddliaceae bacterium]
MPKPLDLPKISLKTILADLYSGFATAFFSIPEGMAYAKIAGVNPIYGLFSSIVPPIVASLSTSTVLMVSTVTSAIAISTKSVLDVADVEGSQLSTALFTLTFLVGVVMFLFGILRLGKIVNFVSNAVMTGFVVGTAFLIIVGELGSLVGLHITGNNKFQEIVQWISHADQWDLPTTLVGVLTIVLMLAFQKIPKVKEAAAILVLLIGSIIVNIMGLSSLELVGSLTKVPSHLPHFVLPDPTLMPRLALGALSIALLALVQGSGISTAVRNPTGEETDYSRDFIATGLGNISGSFFQSMGTGGSFSRTGVNVTSGATSRLSGLFSGLWLILIIATAGKLIEFIPVVIIAGILCVIASQLMTHRYADIKLILTTSPESSFIMTITFLSALFIPLQWTIFLGAGLSFFFYIYSSATKIRLAQLVQNKEGDFETRDLPNKICSNEVTVLNYQGNCFFGELPTIKDLMPSTKEVHNAVIIWRMEGCEDVHSTFLKWMKRFAEEFHANGNQFMIEGVEPHVMKILKKSEIIESIGEENVFPAHPSLLQALEQALEKAHKWIKSHQTYTQDNSSF